MAQIIVSNDKVFAVNRIGNDLEGSGCGSI
jgi:hypothetical protein